MRKEPHGNAKISESDAKEIFYLTHRTTMPLSEIAEMYSISKSAVADIKQGRQWGWATKEQGSAISSE
jgi:uncharacterized protein YjcR